MSTRRFPYVTLILFCALSLYGCAASKASRNDLHEGLLPDQSFNRLNAASGNAAEEGGSLPALPTSVAPAAAQDVESEHPGQAGQTPLIIKQADEFGVAVLLVRTNTMETVEAIERIFGKTRLGQTVKLQQFEALLAKHVDLDRMYQTLDLERRTSSA